MLATAERQMVSTLVTSKARLVVERIDHLRSIRQLIEQARWTQTRVGDLIGVSQPAISQLLKVARVEAPDVRPGMAGGTPYEIAARYAAHLLEHHQMIQQLSAWIYEPVTQDEVVEGDLSPLNLSGFTLQVGRALDERFITEDDYDRILKAVAD